MRPLERHRDAGAYALGVLDAADAFRFEDHLERCPACLLALDELHGVARRLWEYGRVPPTAEGAGAGTARGFADRVVGELGRLCRARRRRRLCAAAVAVVLAVGAPAAAVATADGPGAARDGVTASLAAHDRAWGTEIDLTVRDPAPGHGVCELVAVGKDGSERTVTTWRAKGRTVRTRGVSDLGTAATDHYEVRTAEGRRLTTLRP
ncbi:Zf-HC2 domain-containing protein OS=Streptomyces alboniger OX=132473 GN=CP975_31850 PE=4 SV=1 [Streptomyces alboniger]